MEIPHVQLQGTPYEMGLQHGRQLGGLISDIVDHYGYHSEESEDLRASLAAVGATLRVRCPELVEEMRGIADGAGLPEDEILHLNAVYDARGDLLHAGPRCTAIGLPQTPSGPLVAKTDDVGLDERRFEVAFHGRPASGIPFLCYAFAGSVWNQGGMNQAGLAVAMTGLQPAGGRNPEGIPSLIFLRKVLMECASVDDALTFVQANPLRGYGCSMTMADPAADEVTVVANYPAMQAVRRSTREPTVHTNHPLWPETLALAPDERWREAYGRPGFVANTQGRAQNAMKLVHEIPWSVDGLKLLLGNHAEQGAICQHGQAELHTAFAMIMVPRQRALIVAEGYGCGAYREFTV